MPVSQVDENIAEIKNYRVNHGCKKLKVHPAKSFSAATACCNPGAVCRSQTDRFL
jgi:hypothetical protein